MPVGRVLVGWIQRPRRFSSIFFVGPPGRQIRPGQQRRAPTDQLAAFDELGQLGERQLHLAAARPVVHRCEAALLEALGEQAQAGTVEVQNLGSLTIAADEQIQIAAQRVTAQLLLHQRS